MRSKDIVVKTMNSLNYAHALNYYESGLGWTLGFCSSLWHHVFETTWYNSFIYMLCYEI